MGNSCAGADTSVPGEIEEVMKGYIKKKHPRPFFDQTDDPPNKKHSCVLEDLEGARCPEGTCRYSSDGKPKSGYTSRKPIP